MNDENTSLHSLDLGVGGMTCASCVARVERALKKVPGVVILTHNITDYTRGFFIWFVLNNTSI